MSSVFWPGDEHAGTAFSEVGQLSAMLRVEAAWLDSLVAGGIAPRELSGGPVLGVADDLDATAADRIAVGGESSGNPVLPLLAWLRKRLGGPDAPVAQWVHRGLTSQDVVDTATMLQARDVQGVVASELARQIRAAVQLLGRHGDIPAAGRTLTQPAVPVTVGLRITAWLDGLLSAADGLRGLSFPGQFGGAAGSLSGVVALAAGTADPVGTARAIAADAAERLGLAARPPWHTTRTPVTQFVDACAACTAAWGHVANDVLTGSRPELGELAEASGGGSSTMPQKSNPVLSVLIRRAALSAPALVSLVHLAAADMHDERAAGAWHLEWQPVQLIARHTVTAAVQTTRVLTGLHVEHERAAANLAAARPGIDGERRVLLDLTGADGSGTPAGADHGLAQDVLARAAPFLDAPR